MEFLRFIFSSFWVWLGFTILACVIGSKVIGIVKAACPRREAKVYSFEDGNWRIEVLGRCKNGTAEEVAKQIDMIEDRGKQVDGFRRVKGDDDL